jgi:chemotaxis protein methyltransferase CheR
MSLFLYMNHIEEYTMAESQQLRELLRSIRSVYGYDFTEYSEASLRRRVDGFMKDHNIGSLSMLETALLTNDRVFEQFIQQVTITVTEMFRDPSFYKMLREQVISRLATYPFIKIWVAGSSTGEEAYSVAICLKEQGLLERTIIYATDINQRALQTAKEGVYPIRNIKDYTANYMKSGGQNSFSDYYVAKYDSVLLDRSLKKNIVFSVHNLVIDRSFNEFQLIVCRNVLIYFNQQLQNRVIALFCESLCPLGFLALGQKESLLFAESRTRFSEVDRREKIFIKNG